MNDRPQESFSRVFFAQMILRIGLALGAMALSYAGSALGATTQAEWGPFVGALVGLAIGIVLITVVLRRTGPRPSDPAPSPPAGPGR